MAKLKLLSMLLYRGKPSWLSPEQEKVLGEVMPRVFKTIQVNLEVMDIKHYKQQLSHKQDFKRAVIEELDKRLRQRIPMKTF